MLWRETSSVAHEKTSLNVSSFDTHSTNLDIRYDGQKRCSRIDFEGPKKRILQITDIIMFRQSLSERDKALLARRQHEVRKHSWFSHHFYLWNRPFFYPPFRKSSIVLKAYQDNSTIKFRPWVLVFARSGLRLILLLSSVGGVETKLLKGAHIQAIAHLPPTKTRKVVFPASITCSFLKILKSIFSKSVDPLANG